MLPGGPVGTAVSFTRAHLAQPAFQSLKLIAELACQQLEQSDLPAAVT